MSERAGFALRGPGARRAKGAPPPLPAVVRDVVGRDVVGRDSVGRGFVPGGFVGRGAELAQLDAALERASRLQVPQRVTLCGAAGIGKSRLCRVWYDRLRGVDDVPGSGPRALWVAAPGRDDATRTFDAVAAMVRRRFGLQDASDANLASIQLRDQLQQRLQRSPRRRDVVAAGQPDRPRGR